MPRLVCGVILSVVKLIRKANIIIIITIIIIMANQAVHESRQVYTETFTQSEVSMPWHKQNSLLTSKRKPLAYLQMS
jgi:hypothetical protein